MSDVKIQWTAGAAQALVDNQALVDKVGGGDVEEAKKWHEDKVADFIEETPEVQDANKAKIRYVRRVLRCLFFFLFFFAILGRSMMLMGCRICHPAHTSDTDAENHITTSFHKGKKTIQDPEGHSMWHIPSGL